MRVPWAGIGHSRAQLRQDCPLSHRKEKSMAHCALTFGYVVHFIPREKTGDIRRGGGAGKANEFDVDIRVTLVNAL